MTTKAEHKFTLEEKVAIVATLKRVAVAQAEFWDVLRDIEGEHAIEINPDVALVSEVAGDCGSPPSTLELDDEAVWASFEASLL